jgi:hypothetical protein
MPYLHFETLLGYDMMAKAVSRVKKSGAIHSGLSRDREKDFRTKVHRRDIDGEALDKNQINYEFDNADPDTLIILRYVPRYEMQTLRQQTKLLRENSKRPSDEKIDLSDLEDFFSSDFSEGEDCYSSEKELTRLSAVSTTSRNSIDTGGVLALIKRRLKITEGRMQSQKRLSFRNRKMEEKTRSKLTENEAPDVEKLGEDPGQIVGSVGSLGNRRGRRSLRQALHLPGLWRQPKQHSLSEKSENATSWQVGDLHPTGPVSKNPGLDQHEAAKHRGVHEQPSIQRPGNVNPNTYDPLSDSWRGRKLKNSSDEERHLSGSPESTTRRSRSPESNVPPARSESSQLRQTAQQRPSSPSNPDSKAMELFDASRQPPDPVIPSILKGRSLSADRYIRRTHSSSSLSLQHPLWRFSEPDLFQLQSQLGTVPSPSYVQERRVFIVKDHIDSENDFERNDEGHPSNIAKYIGDNEDIAGPQPLSPRHRRYSSSSESNSPKGIGIPAALVSKKVLIDLGCPFREEVCPPFIPLLLDERLMICAGRIHHHIERI